MFDLVALLIDEKKSSCGYQMYAGKPQDAHRFPRICGRMCRDLGATSGLFTFPGDTFPGGSGGCQCQEGVDDAAGCNDGVNSVKLYRYLGKFEVLH